jgi:hypothetical protein
MICVALPATCFLEQTDKEQGALTPLKLTAIRVIMQTCSHAPSSGVLVSFCNSAADDDNIGHQHQHRIELPNAPEKAALRHCS